MSVSAWATAARRRPSSRRSGGRAWRPSRKAAPAAPSGPVTTTRSPRPGPGAAGHACRAADRGHGKHELRRAAGVPAGDRDAGLVQALVELEHVLELELARRGERDQQRLRLGARGGEVAEVDRSRAVAELAVARPVEPKVDALDERVLRDDEPAAELGCVVLDPAREAAPLELGQQAGLAELREPHRPPPAAPVLRPRPGSPPRRPRPRECSRPRWRRRRRRSPRPGSRPRGRSRRARRRPIAGSASGFEGVGQTGPAPM